MKLCKDCKHLYFEGELTESNAWCNKGFKTWTSPVTGKTVESTRPPCTQMRMTGPCGEDGRYWEPSPQLANAMKMGKA